MSITNELYKCMQILSTELRTKKHTHTQFQLFQLYTSEETPLLLNQPQIPLEPQCHCRPAFHFVSPFQDHSHGRGGRGGKKNYDEKQTTIARPSQSPHTQINLVRLIQAVVRWQISLPLSYIKNPVLVPLKSQTTITEMCDPRRQSPRSIATTCNYTNIQRAGRSRYTTPQTRGATNPSALFP